MRILLIGDVIGRPGRDVVSAELPNLRETLGLDFVIFLTPAHRPLGRPPLPDRLRIWFAPLRGA